MATKIIMLGGRRAGKSSILASVVHQLKNAPADLFTVSDSTDYQSSDKSAVSLIDKRREVERYIQLNNKLPRNSIFQVDMTPSDAISEYQVKTKINGSHDVEFSFVDVPGEAMEIGKSYRKELETLVGACDVFMVAIDTPYMMQPDEGVCDVYNRVSEITDILANNIVIKEDRDNLRNWDKKLIILAPVKCEKWTRSGHADAVKERTLQVYKQLINTWVNNPCVEIWVMPLETVGGIEHASLMDGYRAYKTASDKVGEVVSVNDLTGMVHFKNGRTCDPADLYMVENDPDASLLKNFTQLPLSWYRTNGDKFTPKNCEQPAYQIIRFLVEKEANVFRSQGDSFFRKILEFLGFVPPFGESLAAYKEAVNKIARMVVKDREGIAKITELIP